MQINVIKLMSLNKSLSPQSAKEKKGGKTKSSQTLRYFHMFLRACGKKSQVIYLYAKVVLSQRRAYRAFDIRPCLTDRYKNVVIVDR